MSSSKTFFCITLVVAVTMFMIPAAGYSVTEPAGGKVYKWKMVSADDFVSKSSTDFGVMPDMTRTVKLNKRGRLLITLTAWSYCEGATPLMVSIMVDEEEAFPGETQFASPTGGTWGMTRAMIWTTGRLDPGTHDVKVEWRTTVAGQDIHVDERTLLIQYFK